MFIFLVGLPGVGKSFWLPHFTNALKLPGIDLDTHIEEKTKKTIATLISKGEFAFRKKEQQFLFALLHQYKQAVIATGGGTPCFENNLERMKEAGMVVYITLPLPKIIEQIKQAPGQRPLLKYNSEKELQEKLIKTFPARKRFYEQADLIFDPIHDKLSDIIQRMQQLSQQKSQKHV